MKKLVPNCFYNQNISSAYPPSAIPAEGGSDVTKCSFGTGGTDTYKDKNKKREQISSCFVDNKQFGECNPENKFGYRLGEPCILVKLNRVWALQIL